MTDSLPSTRYNVEPKLRPAGAIIDTLPVRDCNLKGAQGAVYIIATSSISVCHADVDTIADPEEVVFCRADLSVRSDALCEHSGWESEGAAHEGERSGDDWGEHLDVL